MTPEASPVVGLVNELRGLGVKLWLDGERLRFRAPKGALSDELRDRMRARKEELLAFLREVLKARATGAPEIERIDRRELPGGLPLSFAQERLWFLEQWRPAGVAAAAYNVTDVVRLRGRLDAPALERGLGEVVRRHEVLRTTFQAPDGQPVQVVAGELALALPLVDLASLDAAARAGHGPELVDEIGHRPFDLARGPLVRAYLVRLDGDDHLLVVGMHHIVSDGWSTGVLIRELAALYMAFAGGAASPLPPLAVQYADFAVWQRRWLESAALDEQMAYWKERLAGAAGVLELPADRPRPPVQTFRGALRHFSLPAALVAGLGRLEDRGTTRFMILLAAFATLLGRYTAAGDLLIGTPVANRQRSELEGLIGFFVNTLVIRTELGGDPPFRTLLERVRATALAAFAHQDVPFEKLVEELEPRRDASRSPLFQVLFVHEKAPLRSLAVSGLTLEPVLLENRTAKFDLSLMVSDGGAASAAMLEYSTDLFDAATMARLAGHYRRLLQNVAESPGRRLSELSWLSAGERQQLAREWRGEAGDGIAGATLDGLFRARAERSPEATALACGDGHLTCGELRRRAQRLARHLRGLGVGPEVRVGLATARDADMVVGLLAILTAGGAYVPLDPAYPPERLRFMVDDAGVRVLLTQEKLLGALSGLDVPAVRVGAEWGTLADDGAADPAPAGGAGRLAYVIYTSGSTGRPKGVAIEHRSAVALLHWARRVVSAADLAGFAATTSICFDLSVFELFVPLAWGGKAILFENALALASDAAAAAVRLVNTVPSAAAELSRLGALPPSAGTVNLAGEPLKGALAAALYEHPPVRRVYNLYGPSEDTTYSTYCLVPPGAGEPSIGRPVAATEARVLDRRGRTLPIGTPGELHLGGSGLARGYLGRPALTAAGFVPHAASDVPGARLYRTGDRVRCLPSGELAFLGRVDHQVKVRGFRIEPGEIEAALGKYPGIRDVAVHLWRAPGGDSRLVAYLVAGGEAPPAAEPLRAFLARTLPAHMVPSAFVPLDRLPLTPNGKVDRKALPAPQPGPADGGAGVAPRTSLEVELAAIWRDALGLEALGVHDDFFKLGGHSLLATRIVARIDRSLGVALPVRQIFETPTVAGLAERVDAALASGGHDRLPPLERAPREAPLPLSHAQERLWLFEQLNPGTAVYTTSRAGHLRGPLRVTAVEAVLNEVLRRHEALRTRFAAGPDGEPRQVIEAHRPRRLPVVDLEALPAARRPDEALRLGLRESRTSFDLTRAPLLRAVLMRLAPEEHVVSLSIHHICFDLWSGNVLLRELEALYPAAVAGRPSPLAELPIQYPDFAFWQRRWLTSAALATELAYWRRRLSGAAPMNLPTDRPRPPVERFHGGTHGFGIEPRLSAGLTTLGRSESVTQFIAFLALFKALLYRLTRHRRVIVSTAISNRRGAELDGVIGFFDNLVVLATETAGAGGWTFRRLLAEVRETALGAYSHQHVPFERLLQELQPERGHRTPLVQAVFIFELDHPAMARRLAGLEMKPYQLEMDTSKFDLTLSLRDAPDGGLVGQLNYNGDLFDGTTVARLAGHYRELFAAVLAAPDRPLAELTLLRAAERWQLRGEWNDAAVACPPRVSARELLAAQARRRPMAVAVAGDGEAWTYGELEERAERLARRLGRLGVGVETRVGVCAERSPAMIAALYAIWKAGGAYVPLDPAYPPARLAYVLEDARAPVLIAEERLAAQLEPGTSAVVPLERAWDETGEGAAEAAGTNTDTHLAGDNLAYVIYTSGSTGRPKGVEICHRTLWNLIAWHWRAFAVTAASRATQLAGVAFDASVWEIWPYLTLGASLHLPDEAARTDPERLRDWLLDRRVTVSFLPTPLAESVLALDWPRRAPLALLLTGGDRLHRPPAPGLPFALVNNYGPTENTVVATSGPVAPRAAGRAPSIGRPIGNVTARVVDESLGPLPIGLPGELLIGGASLARGYRAGGETTPARTAERFVPDALSGAAGGRLYRTGDLVRLLYDGAIDFLGRLDHQVKVRGFRIELAEIEAALARHPRVAAAAVVAPEAADGTRRLVAFAVPAAGAAITPGELGADLARSLPAYMVPAVVKTLDALPLTPNGKVDREALPVPDLATENTVAPRTPLEDELAAIWREVLGVDRLGVHDDFFALGGHSLAATRITARIARGLGVALAARQVFETPTVAGLAIRVDEVMTAGGGGAVGLERAAEGAPVTPVPRQPRMPLSFAQRRLWFLHQVDPGSAAYHIDLSARLRGVLDHAALTAAVVEVVRRHEVLRTRFVTTEGEPWQVIETGLRMPVLRVDLDHLPPPAAAAAAARLVAAETARPFDLGAVPLFRLAILRFGDEDHALILVFHHIVYDGWSNAIFARELFALYEAARRGRPSPLPELPVQYADFALWQQRWLAGEGLSSQLEPWRRRLAGVEVLRLPTDRPREGAFSTRGREVEFTFPDDLGRRLESLGRRSGATPFMTLLAAFLALLHRHTGQEDLALGSPVANRTRREIEGLVGFFVNTLVLRVDAGGAPSFVELLRRTRHVALEAFEHQDLPFERLVEALRPSREEGFQPLFQVLFALQNSPVAGRSSAELTLEPLDLPGTGAGEGESKFDLALSLEIVDGALQGAAEYRSAFFDDTTVRRLVAHYRVLLEGAADHPETSIGELPLLRQAERHQVVVEWRDLGIPAELGGEAPAVVADGGRRPLPIGVWGRLHRQVDGGPLEPLDGLPDRAARRRWDGRLETAADAATSGRAAAPVDAGARVSRRRAELARRRGRLSESQRRRLEERLAGAAGAGAGPARPRREPSPLVPIQPRGDGPPFFCVHAVGGTVFAFHALARALGPEQPFFGLQAAGFEPGERPESDLRTMAEAYVAAIRRQQEPGPYSLGGWSMGGVVAFEMARRLRREGNEVALLALLDSWVPADEAAPGGDVFAGFVEELEGLTGGSLGLAAGDLAAGDLDDRLARVLAAVRDRGGLPAAVDAPRLRRWYEVYAANVRALAGWAPAAYDGRVTLFRPRGLPARHLEASVEAWRRLARQVDLVCVPGNHVTMLAGEGVASLGTELGRRLRRPDSPAGSPR